MRLDTTRLFATRRVLGDSEYLTGQLALRVRPGVYRLSVVVGDGAWEAGALARIGGLHVPAPDAPAVTMSDLVLGREGSGQVWRSGQEAVPLNPLNSYARDGAVQVFYQLGGLQPGRRYRTVVEVGERGREPAVRVSFDDTADAGRANLSRTVGLNELERGTYLLTVRIEDDAGRVQVERSQTLNVVE